MKWLLYIVAMLLVGQAYAVNVPIIIMIDLDSGPNSGNTDTSVTATGGAYVTLYGNWFENYSSVKLGGSSCLTVVSGPVAYMSWEKMIVKIGTGCGSGNFSITTPGGTWNQESVSAASAGLAQDFAVRSGTICFVKTAGNGGSDSNSGTFGSPYLTMSFAYNHCGAEGITYVGNGVTNTGTDGSGWGVVSIVPTNSGPGPNGYPRAIGIYPGATATAGATSLGANRAAFEWADCSGTGGAGAGYVSIFGLNMVGSVIALGIQGPATVNATYGSDCNTPTGAASTHVRVVGNDLTAPLGTGSSGCIHLANMGGSGSTWQNWINFNNVHDCGVAPADDQYHGIYAGDNTRWTEIAWNWVTNIVGCRGIQLYSNYQYQWGLGVHDNTIRHTSCDGIVMSTNDPSQGVNKIYNNEFQDTGEGPENLGEGGGAWNCVYQDRHVQPMAAGTESPASGQNIVANNSCFRWGTVSNSGYATCDNTFAAFSIANDDDTGLTEKFQNNAMYTPGTTTSQCPTGVPYWMNSTSTSNALSGSNNLMFGHGTPPVSSFVTNTVNANPGWVNTSTFPYDLHLASSGSPANGAGTTSGFVPTYDHDGLVRPSPPSIGAYEFAPGSPPPTTHPVSLFFLW